MPSAYMVRSGIQGMHLDDCIAESYIGVDFGLHEDLAGRFPDNWKEFNQEFVPVWLSLFPDKSRVAAGLACGSLWTVGRGINEGDLVISPTGGGGPGGMITYRAARVAGPYRYVDGAALPHRRPVHWLPGTFSRAAMSEGLQRSTKGPLTVVNLTEHEAELLELVGDQPMPPDLVASDPAVEDPSVFALEKHLEDFLVANWAQTELGQDFLIYTDDGDVVGQQYPTDTGPIDILAISHDGKTLLVVELKRGRTSDVVVGQVQRYMGFAMAELAEPGQEVRGAIIALEDDLKTQRALLAAPNIDFYRYQVNFKLHKA
jgi:restriction system protein